MKNLKAICWIFDKLRKFCMPYMLAFLLIQSITMSLSLVVNFVNKVMIEELSNSVLITKFTNKFLWVVVAYIILYFIIYCSKILNMFGINFFQNKADYLFFNIYSYKLIQTSQEEFFKPLFLDRCQFDFRAVNRIIQFIKNIMSLVFNELGILMGGTIVFIFFEPVLIIYILLSALFIFFILRKQEKRKHKLEKKQISDKRKVDYYTQVLSAKSFAKELRIFKTQEFFMNRWKQVYKKVCTESINIEKKNIDITCTTDVLIDISSFCSIFFLV